MSVPSFGIGYTKVKFIEKSQQMDHEEEMTVVRHNSTMSSIKITDLRILAAEDNDSNFLLIRNILKGNRLTRAVTGTEAVEKIRAQTFDVVFMDIRMPVMSGLEATSVIREFDSVTPIIALTANAFDSDKDEALAVGCNYFITKPLKKRELIELLSKFC